MHSRSMAITIAAPRYDPCFAWRGRGSKFELYYRTTNPRDQVQLPRQRRTSFSAYPQPCPASLLRDNHLRRGSYSLSRADGANWNQRLFPALVPAAQRRTIAQLAADFRRVGYDFDIPALYRRYERNRTSPRHRRWICVRGPELARRISGHVSALPPPPARPAHSRPGRCRSQVRLHDFDKRAAIESTLSQTTASGTLWPDFRERGEDPLSKLSFERKQGQLRVLASAMACHVWRIWGFPIKRGPTDFARRIQDLRAT